MADIKYLTIEHLTRFEIKRLFSKIKTDPRTGCWLWVGGLNRPGYGKIKFRKRDESTHRLMWAWLIGPLPKGQAKDIPNLDHIACDTKKCCFPAHLRLVLPKENTLRSHNPPAQNARKTHCQRGHQLPTSPSKSEGRACQICRKDWHQSDRYKKWNAAYGRDYHQRRRHGPDREAFLKRQREYMRAWKARRKNASH